MIRKEGFVAPAVLEELKRIIEDSEVGSQLHFLFANIWPNEKWAAMYEMLNLHSPSALAVALM